MGRPSRLGGAFLASGLENRTACTWDVKKGMKASDGWAASVTWRQPDQTLVAMGDLCLSTSRPRRNFPGMLGDCRRVIKDFGTETRKAEGLTAAAVRPGQEAAYSSLRSSSGPGHGQDVTCMAKLPNGETIASVESDGTICFWDGTMGMQQCTKEEDIESVSSLVFSRCGRRLVSDSSDGNAFVWDVVGGRAKLRHRLQRHDDWVRCVAMSSNDRLVATASDD
ncbi:hypothetical protein N0V93_010270 [Gnomoniopsis smithogilvyi]|uniref:Uncharacterized protein n=1 Tax=Gnomoniopsis smithogilvyi TaxID=1191159 RepID=A0A9W8YKK1_9PEZI|nr:hypothetical protein N0V93_010270 [Gnomoniopsis smithogilvyi]